MTKTGKGMIEKENVIKSKKLRNRRNFRNRKIKGSYTAEASLLMGIILSVLAAVIYIGFWYHDRSFLQSAAYEAACGASLHAEEKTYQITEKAQQLTRGRMLGTRSLNIQCSDGKEEASVVFQGTFQIPGMLAAYFSGERLHIKETCTLSTERPSRKIQKVRGVWKVIKKAGGK